MCSISVVEWQKYLFDRLWLVKFTFFDAAFSFAKELEVIHKKTIYIYTFTDSKQAFDADTKGRKASGKRMVIDILATHEA